MAIRLNIRAKQRQMVKELGAELHLDGKTWFIPDHVTNINPFKEWLPEEEGIIVQRPYFVVRTKGTCWKCGKETPLIALGTKSYQTLVYKTPDRGIWKKEDYPILFTEIERLEGDIIESLQSNYSFFKKAYSKSERKKKWGNFCVHCQARQEDDDEFIYEAGPLSPLSIEEAKELRIIYFKLAFDYYISGGYSIDPLIEEVLA